MAGRGDEVLKVIANTASFTQLVSNVSSSCSAIQKALSDIKDLPIEIKELRHTVEEGYTKVENLPRILEPAEWDRFLPNLEELSDALKSARDLEVRLSGDENFGRRFTQGLLGSGASEQIKEAKRLKKLIVRCLIFISGALEERSRRNPWEPCASESTQAAESGMEKTLERLSRQNLEEEIIENVLAAPSHSTNYKSLETKTIDSVDENADEDEDDERGSVKGGTYEVENNSKIRLVMKYENLRFFYIVTFDSSNREPQLFYPDITLAKNELHFNRSRSMYTRIFPDPIRFKNDDPGSWKLTKHADLRIDQVEFCYVYVVFSCSRLESDGQVPSIVDVKRKLGDEGSWSDDEFLVKRLQFDVK